MKKFLSLMLALVMVASLCTGCGAKKADTYEIALVTDVGNIDDKSFNQGAWEGVKEYAEKNKKTYNYYRPSEDSTEARVETIKQAIDKGAKVVVCPGYLFEDAIYEVQDQYADVQFLLLDGEPHTADYSVYKTADNTHNILYKEEQAGYLAGYAAVKEGYRSLGFLGGMAVPAVIRYGYGFVQGANDAAKELGVEGDVSIKYWYCGGFAPSDDIKTKMSGWYTAGTEVVFSCGGGIYLSCTAAAEAAGAKVIGVDVDQSAESATIITSAMKELANSVVLALTDLYANGGKWPADLGGKTSVLGAVEGCVGLPTATWSMKNFTVDEYKTLFEKVKNGEISISNSTDAAPAVAITVDYQE
ncbi:basic membrane protein A [Lachnospiraceae bacterium YSD2013]|nr:BMP family ABC transporter substrate-binding protein [Lachnospiraceae bacterium]SCX07181.1 basic membrane protein A [Lachnospiraceae bacterium YSD2013]